MMNFSNDVPRDASNAANCRAKMAVNRNANRDGPVVDIIGEG